MSLLIITVCIDITLSLILTKLKLDYFTKTSTVNYNNHVTLKYFTNVKDKLR